MITEKMTNQGSLQMLIPKSMLFSTLKEAISTGNEEKIRDLSDILYGTLEMNMVTGSRIDVQHEEILQSIETMKEGFRQIDKRFELVEKRFEEVDRRFEQVDKRFEQVDKRFEQVDKRFEQVDKRFDDLIHQMDKRFEATDRRFDDMNRRFTFQSWLIGIGFVSINTMVVLLKIFG